MANLAMAIPSMQSGEPQGSADDAIVTEKSFVQFANSFDKLSAKIVVNKKKTQRVHERIDLMMERRARRLGQPERARAEEDEDQEATGGVIKNVISVFGTIIKGILGFLSTVGKWLMKNLLRFGGIGLAAKAAIGLLFGKAGLIAGFGALTAIGLGFLAKEVIDIFSSSGDSEKSEEPPDFVGDGDDTEAPAPVVEEVDVAVADFVGDGDDTEAPTPAPVVAPAPAPVVDPVPIPKTKPPVPQRPPAAAPARPKAAAPSRPRAVASARPSAAAPKPVSVKVSAPARPQRVPEKVAKKQPGTPVKKDAFDREFESGDAISKKYNDSILKENQLNDKIKEIRFKTLPAAQAAADKKFFPNGFQTEDPSAEGYAPEVAKLEQLLSKLKEEERQVSAQVKELYEQMTKVDADKGDFEISDKEFEMGDSAKTKSTSSESSTTTVKKQETAVQTKTETQTGGGSTVRRSAEYADTEKTKELRAELSKLERDKDAHIKQLKLQGKGFSDYIRDPKFKEFSKRENELELLIEKSRTQVSAGSVTRTPGKDIRKTSTKVIVKPIIVSQETRVR